jgi:ribosome maturation factor RimP
MSGSSRHGSVRQGAAGRATGERASGERASGGRAAGGRGAAGRAAAGRASAQPAAAGRADAEQVAALARPVVGAAGLDLEGVKITMAGRRRLVRLVVDGDGGVSLDDIALVSRELSAVLDASPVLGEQPYTLEVSSPGVDRPLTERRHWRRAIGRLVAVPVTTNTDTAATHTVGAGTPATGAPATGTPAAGAPASGAVTLTGRVTGASADAVTLDIDGQTRQFGYGDLGPGRIQIEFAPIGDDDDPGADADEEGPDGY